jgi:Bacterial conjugation TrbI-like protein
MNTNQEDKSEAFEQGEILSEIKPQPQPPAGNKVIPFNPLDMASLAGLKTPNPAESALGITEREENIAESKTKLPIYKQSLYQLVTIGGALLIATLALGAIVFGGQKQETVAATPTPAPSPSEKSQADFKPDPRFGVVNSKLAMEGQQRDIIAAAVAQQKASADKTAADTVAAVPPVNSNLTPSTSLSAKNITPPTTGDPQVVTNATPQPDPIYQSPPPAIKPAPVAHIEPVNPRPITITRKIEPPAQKVALVAPQPTKVIAPSRIEVVRQQPINSSTASTRIPPVSWEVANRNAVGVWGRTSGGETSSTIPATVTPTRLAQATASSSVAVVGQQIKAKMITPFQISTAVSSQPIFLALTAPILDSGGKVILPTGSQVMTEVSALDNGMLQVISAKASVNGQLVELPKQALVLQDASKQPLVAQVKVFGQGEVFNRDLMSFFGGALQAVGKNLTQPQTQTIATGGGFLQTSNPQQNIVGSVLDGGFSPLVSQWMERNKQATTQINSASKIWFLPTGTEVNLIVAQPFSL